MTRRHRVFISTSYGPPQPMEGTTMKQRLLALSILALALAAVAGIAFAPPGSSRGFGRTPKMPPAASFSARVDNPWFPLLRGTRWVYTGVKDGKQTRDVVKVTGKTKTIEGVPCIAVSDRLYMRGRLEERTTDWYSQDSRGNVWYLGENTAELDANGHVTSREGSWQAGVHDAKAGVYIPGHPHLGQTAIQEYLKGHAEDHFRIIGLFNTVAPRGKPNTLLTKEWTPLEPGVIDHKMYVRGIGTVLEQSQKGPNERNELVAVTRR
jgi:hypothetical protein